jgi:hypothetical protein
MADYPRSKTDFRVECLRLAIACVDPDSAVKDMGAVLIHAERMFRYVQSGNVECDSVVKLIRS